MPRVFIAVENDLAYLAGLIDGEGSISLSVRSDKTNRAWIGIRVAIGMTDEPVIRWLAATFGGSVSHRTRRDPRWRDVFIWTISQQQAAALLKEVRPFLRVKYRQADVVMLVAADLKYHRWNPVTERVIEGRQLAVKMMHELNRRGAA